MQLIHAIKNPFLISDNFLERLVRLHLFQMDRTLTSLSDRLLEGDTSALVQLQEIRDALIPISSFEWIVQPPHFSAQIFGPSFGCSEHAASSLGF